MFLNTTDTISLSDAVIHLRDGGIAEPRARPGHTDVGSWTVRAIHADTDHDLHSHVWERHPSGQEVLCVLAGAIDVHLRDHGDGTRPVATVTAGRAFIVPVDRWHRLTVREPGDLLAITPSIGSRHEPVAAAANGTEG